MKSFKLRKTLTLGTLFAAVTLASSASFAADWFPYKAESTEPAFAADGKKSDISYTPLAKASKKWDICVSFPHMKDAYWLGVDYGVVEEAKRLGVKLQLVEAGGYTNLNKQISQIEDCVARGANAVVIGAISGDGLNNLIKKYQIVYIRSLQMISKAFIFNCLLASRISRKSDCYMAQPVMACSPVRKSRRE